MPELPEVETVRRGLAPVLVGSRVAALDARRPDLRFPLPERFGERLVGQNIVGLERRAKYLIAALSGGEDLVMHLGMTGRFTIVHDGLSDTPGEYVHETGPDPTHDHVVLRLSDGTQIIYNDPRRFGFMVMMPHAERSRHALFRDLGAEPLGDDLTAEYLALKAQGKKVNLKAFLMDQHVVAGLGNIYVSEALFQAGLSPNRPAASLANRRGAPTERPPSWCCDQGRAGTRNRCGRFDASRLSPCRRKARARFRNDLRSTIAPARSALGLNAAAKYGVPSMRDARRFIVGAVSDELISVGGATLGQDGVGLDQDDAETHDCETAGKEELVCRPIAFVRCELPRTDKPDKSDADEHGLIACEFHHALNRERARKAVAGVRETPKIISVGSGDQQRWLSHIPSRAASECLSRDKWRRRRARTKGRPA